MNSASVFGPAGYGNVPSASQPVTRNACGPMYGNDHRDTVSQKI
jgi:hypothetical protein